MRREQKVSVGCERVRGKKMWRVRFFDAASGRSRRLYFRKEVEAEAEAARRRGSALAPDQQFFLLSHAERENLLLARRLAAERGLDLLRLVMAAAEPAAVPTADDFLRELLAAKRNAGRAQLYVQGLAWIWKQFIAGRGQLPISQFGLPEVSAFLDSKKLAYRSTLRARLSSGFKFAVRRGWLAGNPCDRLEAVKVLKSPPQIFTPAQVQAALQWLRKNPEGLGWFVLTTFAGLRPEEAMKVDPKKHFRLDGDRPHIEVTPDITKTGQWRFVYPLAEVVSALKAVLKKRGVVLPLPAGRKKKLLPKLRAELGFAQWPKDITRHSASSYWLAISNDQKHVAEMLGHSERTARAIYKKPVERADAEKFYAALRVLK